MFIDVSLALNGCLLFHIWHCIHKVLDTLPHITIVFVSAKVLLDLVTFCWVHSFGVDT